MEINEWLLTDLGKDIWNRKYKFENENFEQWLDRVSSGNQRIRQLIKEKKFLFGGRILANRGLQNQGRKITLSNCYVITPPEDNIESIFDCAKKLARTYSYGGGCGIDISKLAPVGAKVNNAAKETSGSCSFMELYDLTTKLIGQNGRRGALMISMDCSHPDIEEFINLKSDLTKVTKANISIKITDEFMQAVKNDEDWILSFYRPEINETVQKVVKAKELFRQMAKMNWDYSEPGLLNWDRINSWNLLSEDKNFSYAGVNPCFTGDMKLLTVDGYKTFEELNNKDVNIVNSNGEITNGKVWCSGEKETVKLILSNKQIITCTPDHRFMTIDGEECQARDLKNTKIMPKTCYEKQFDNFYVKLGFIQGDGQLTRINSKYHEGVEVNIGYKDGDIYDLFDDESFTKKSDRAIYLDGYKQKLIDMGFSRETLPNRTFPISYNNWTDLQKASFLQGCYSANGSIIKKHRIAYKTTCKDYAKQLQNALSYFNINSYITTNKSKKVKFDNGEYVCKESYDVNISKFLDIQKFHQEIGFYQQYKKIQLQKLIMDKVPYIMSIKENGKHKVYDFKEPKTHWGIVEGFVAHNCAEEPLPAGGSCLLGSINLSEFVINPFLDYPKFDFEAFEECVKQGVIALNEVLHEGLNLHPLQEQRDSVNDWRQIGLGAFGWHDTLIKMGIRYGSKESFELAGQIGFDMINNAIKYSAYLADEYGCYPMYDKNAIFHSDFFRQNTDMETRVLVQKHGLANSQLLTIPPTGSIATMLGVSTALEPIYNISYTRKTESLHGEDKYYKVYTPIIEAYMKINNITDEKDLPNFINTAMTLNYKERIKIQAIWQSFIDASISSTVNVSKDFTIEETEDLYIEAWEQGLKGVTIFRDGCSRVGILTNTENRNEQGNSEQITEFPRGCIENVPEELNYRKYKLQTGCGQLYFFLGIDEYDNKIYDCFCNTDGVSGCNINTQAVSRLLSAGLRGGVPINYLIKQLDKAGVCPSYQYHRGKGEKLSPGKSCASAIGNVIKGVLKEFNDNEKEKTKIIETVLKVETIKNNSGISCPECGEPLRFEGGCQNCQNCGYSKCQ